MQDKQGREYVKLSKIRKGDIVRVDGGFTCLQAWSTHEIDIDRDGRLFIICAEGQHTLDGQVANEIDDSLIGIYYA